MAMTVVLSASLLEMRHAGRSRINCGTRSLSGANQRYGYDKAFLVAGGLIFFACGAGGLTPTGKTRNIRASSWWPFPCFFWRSLCRASTPISGS